MGFMFWLLAWTMDWQAIECSCLLSILTTITWGRPCTVLPWGSFSWSPQRRSRVARERSLRGPAPTGNLVNGHFIGKTWHGNFWEMKTTWHLASLKQTWSNGKKACQQQQRHRPHAGDVMEVGGRTQAIGGRVGSLTQIDFYKMSFGVSVGEDQRR